MRQTKYTKTLYKAIRKLNLDKEELKQTLLCLYINGCPSEDCARLFGTTKEKVINFLESEGLYGYKACSECGKLKDRTTGFKKYTTQIYLICKDCKKEYLDRYGKNNREKKREYDKEYQKNNKERIKEYKINNKERTKEYNKEYNQREASVEQVQNLATYEEVSGNQIRCKYCGRWMTPTVNQVNNRLNGIKENDSAYIYCSEKCKEECPTYNQSKYPKGFKPASSREVNPVLRQIVLERDEYTCQKCHNSQDELEVGLHCHHITPVINSPIEANDPETCTTLCKDCHQIVHKIPGCRYHELRCENYS